MTSLASNGMNDTEAARLSHDASQYNEYPAAIWGYNLNKVYGRGKNKVHGLNNLKITVPRGSIYGLLGPSGCGKTTLLRSILGRIRIDSGHLLVLGDKPGARGHEVPGKMVGYMPQETALFPDLTITETLKYFGTLNGMPSKLIKERSSFLVEFLTLPDKDRLVGQLSGGQMRRVSIAVALLHEPELLILDEPTVGVDPLLRERIWDHLINITTHSENKTTIILTTHYIEEARQAEKVGFMRNGRILTEGVPRDILEQYKMKSLEDVFLKLCQEDIEGTPPDLMQPDQSLEDVFLKLCQEAIEGMPSDLVQPDQYNRQRINNPIEEDEPLLADHSAEPTKQELHKHHTGCLPFGLPRWTNIMAQFVKNMHLLRRNIGFLLFQFMLPVFESVLFCICIGNDPYGLSLAVINNDIGPFGQQFLHAINNNSIKQIDYTHRGYADAYHSVKDMKTWGIVMLGQNFSEDLGLRFASAASVSEAVLNGSSIKLQIDSTNQQIYLTLVQRITEAFETFSSQVLQSLKLNPKLASLPIEMLKPVYGKSDSAYGESETTLTDFMAPGVILSITFFLAEGMTTLVFVMDRKLGMFDRCLASGMVSFEIMMAHMFSQMLIVVVQVALLLVIMLYVFHIACNGPLIWVILLVLLQGFCGMSLGSVFASICNDLESGIMVVVGSFFPFLLISGVLFAAICKEVESGLQLALGSYFPLILISGIIWPVESMPQWLQYISWGTPMTLACEAMRCILARGLDITFYTVWAGYLVTIGWSTGFVLIGLDITFYTVWAGYLVTIGWSAGFVLIGAIILRFKE